MSNLSSDLQFSPSRMFISIDSTITEAAMEGVPLKKGVLENLTTFFHKKTPVFESFFNKVTIYNIEEPESWMLYNILIKIYFLGTKKNELVESNKHWKWSQI